MSHKIIMFILMLNLLIFLLDAGCGGHSPTSAEEIANPVKAPLNMLAMDQARAWADLQKQVDFGPRVPGTKAHQSARDWLIEQLTPSADKVELQSFTHTLGGQDIQMWNIIGHIPGVGKDKRELVLLAAHWDSRPIADHDPDPAKRKTPIDGADDGASGVAVLLEMARQLKAHPIARDVDIVFFDGEDYGPDIDNMLLGSKFYAAHLPDRKPDWGILFDMVGDKDLDIYREPYSDAHAKAVNDRIFRAARDSGYIKVGDASGFVDSLYKYWITDDHTPVNEAGVPMIDLIDFDYPAWHTTADTPAMCSANSLRIVGNTVLYALQLD